MSKYISRILTIKSCTCYFQKHECNGNNAVIGIKQLFCEKWETDSQGQSKPTFFAKVGLKLSATLNSFEIIFRKIQNGARNKNNS